MAIIPMKYAIMADDAYEEKGIRNDDRVVISNLIASACFALEGQQGKEINEESKSASYFRDTLRILQSFNPISYDESLKVLQEEFPNISKEYWICYE